VCGFFAQVGNKKRPVGLSAGHHLKKLVAAAFLFELVTPQLNNKEPLPFFVYRAKTAFQKRALSLCYWCRVLGVGC